MNIAVTGIPNPILDGKTPADKLRAAIAAERELMILPTVQGGREFIETGKKAAALSAVIQSGQVKLIRSKSLTGSYYLGLFDEQLRLRILVCRAPAIPPKQCPYKLNIHDKEVVSEFIKSVEPVYGTAAVVCVCETTWS